MPILTSEQRKLLEDACVNGRSAAEQAVRAAFISLAIAAERPPGHLNDEGRQLRRGLRAKARQLGDQGENFDLLGAECAYEQWHRLLFARFLAENNLLIHPEYRAPVTLADCEELAESLEEPDGWSVAARFAAEILPGIFRLDDPCVRLRLAPEGRLSLESIVANLPREVFVSDDALGWVYQYWQKLKKDQVNASERKIGGADLAPVTQLFTEHYMVRFLLENTLGAWWAARHPGSPLIKEFEYLCVDGNGSPAAGSFADWPDRVADVTVMDPCCGSGHFLVEAFSMLWQMRAEEEGLADIDAQDAVLRGNLFGLELDPRCVQIAMFTVAQAAWKQGGGWRVLPAPNIACSGIPVNAPVEEWKALAGGNSQLENALVRLHVLFRDADSLGSLIDPKRAVEIVDSTGLQQSFEDVDWEAVAPIIVAAATRERHDPAAAVLGGDAASIARAADYLSDRYTLVVTNPPFLVKTRFGETLREFIEVRYRDCGGDLASAFVSRCLAMTEENGAAATVSTENWLTLSSFTHFRERLIETASIRSLSWLGDSAFSSNMIGTRVRVVLSLIMNTRPKTGSAIAIRDVSGASTVEHKARALKGSALPAIVQSHYRRNPDCRFTQRIMEGTSLLGDFVDSSQGICTGDYARFGRYFWELPTISSGWERQQSSPKDHGLFSGRSKILRWEGGAGELIEFIRSRLGEGAESAWVRGLQFRGKQGVAVMQAGNLKATPFSGDLFDDNTVVLVPRDQQWLPALQAYVMSGEFEKNVRLLVGNLKVADRTMLKVPFDVDRWLKVAEERFPNGLSEPWSDDPTQWLFNGRPESSRAPLHVAVGRLIGYEWPARQFGLDELDAFADADGIMCLPSVAGEAPAADRLQHLIATAFGPTWSPGKVAELLEATGSKKKNLDQWLRDDFFKQHCTLFANRPFVWHIWDGRPDGFAALVNYHRLDRKTLEKLTYTYLGDWIERQRAEMREEVAGAEARLSAANQLRKKLELVLDGDPPYDIYVRWKSLADQPIGWDPDLNDGVRVNVRPFVEAAVLRATFNIHWKTDRGKNPDGSERLNDRHITIAEKRAARGDLP